MLRSLLVALVIAAAACSGAPFGESTWRYHPKGLAIRTCVEAAEAAIAEAKPSERHFSACRDREGDTSRYAYRDTGSVIRKLVIEAASSDSSTTMTAYYDERGSLCFVFIKGDAENHAELETRIYVDNGRRLFEKQSYLTGIGSDFPSPWPNDDIPYSAPARFSRHVGCEDAD